jgi:hypothetical protein
MKNHTQLALATHTVVAIALIYALCPPVFAQSGPGEDPISAAKIAKTEMRPGAASQVSGSLDPLFGMPGWLKARVSRYEARAYSDNAGDTIVTDNDAVTTASAQGLRKTCVQEVGSTSTNAGFGTKYGPKGAAQIVVLKGDLVNICK